MVLSCMQPIVWAFSRGLTGESVDADISGAPILARWKTEMAEAGLRDR
jgi:hypothetical protein